MWMGDVARPIAGAVGIIAFGSALLVACGKEKEQSPSSAQATAATAAAAPATPSPRILSEREEVVAVIQVLWPHARKVDKADFRWAGCSDRAVGFNASRDCLEGVLKEIEDLRAKMPTKLKVQSQCGIDAEKAHRDFVDGRVAFLSDHLAWMDKNATTLKRMMVSKSLSNAWSAMPRAAKESRPLDLANEKYTGGLLVITKLPCMASVLSCPSFGCNSGVLNKTAGLPP
ncbi:hypothetical protein [Sorangium sp. So ce233]|uniref:hypothetical protein n=1 Tax=Sorangium sp. So ce233 TaxID=3133290 RepID=UPI003F5E0FBF